MGDLPPMLQSPLEDMESVESRASIPAEFEVGRPLPHPVFTKSKVPESVVDGCSLPSTKSQQSHLMIQQRRTELPKWVGKHLQKNTPGALDPKTESL